MPGYIHTYQSPTNLYGACMTTLKHDVWMSFWLFGSNFDVIFRKTNQRQRRLEEEPNWTVIDCKLKYFSHNIHNTNLFSSFIKSMQEKEFIMVVRCELKIPSLGITVRHHSASLEMPNSYTHDGILSRYIFLCVIIELK